MKQISRNKILTALNRYNMIVILVLMVVAATILSPVFFTADNLLNVFRASSMIGIVAVGMTLVILTGGIDLSVGSIVGLSGALAAGFWRDFHSTPLIFLVPLAVGAAFGILNGFLVTRLRLQAFVATLATMTIARGLGLIYTAGQPIYVDYPPAFLTIAQSYVAGIPTPAVLFVFVTVLFSVVLHRWPLGRWIYAVGGNEEATRLAGINANRVKVIVYCLGGLLAAFAGLVLTARMQSGEPGQAGVGWELDAIASVVIGGTLMTGGIGNVGMTFIGALMIGILANMFNLLGLDPPWQQLAKGVVIILAIWFQSARVGQGAARLPGKSRHAA
jgi:ribose transport system permease protein